jgi:hypothetical protein
VTARSWASLCFFRLPYPGFGFALFLQIALCARFGVWDGKRGNMMVTLALCCCNKPFLLRFCISQQRNVSSAVRTCTVSPAALHVNFPSKRSEKMVAAAYLSHSESVAGSLPRTQPTCTDAFIITAEVPAGAVSPSWPPKTTLPAQRIAMQTRFE